MMKQPFKAAKKKKKQLKQLIQNKPGHCSFQSHQTPLRKTSILGRGLQNLFVNFCKEFVCFSYCRLQKRLLWEVNETAQTPKSHKKSF